MKMKEMVLVTHMINKIKANVKIGLLALSAAVVLCACNNQPIESTNPTESANSDSENRTVYTYIDETFDELEVGDSLEEKTSIFEYYEGGGFIASSKDEDGNVWIRAKDVNDGSQWALAYTNVYQDNVKVALKNFCVQFDTRLPYTEGISIDPDGGACILWSPQAGRYDLAMHHCVSTNGNSINSFNLWHAMNTDGGPMATTQHDETWGERGSTVGDFSLAEDVSYTVTICGKHQGIDSDGNEFFTLYVFVDDELVIYQRDVTYWDGGFGLRGFISPYEYANFKVTDFPLVCPDGIDHWTVDDENTTYPINNYEKLATPEVTLEGNMLSWNAVEGASAYNIVFDGVRVGHTADTSFDISQVYGEGEISVSAATGAFGVNSSDYAGVPISNTIPTLEAPEISLNGTTLSWNAVDGASLYQVYANGKLLTEQAGTSLNLQIAASNNAAVTGKSDYEITVIAVSNQENVRNSQQSNMAICELGSDEGTAETVLETPVLRYEDGVISWNPVDGALKYVIYRNGIEYAETTEPQYVYSLLGVYSIQAVGDNAASELSALFTAVKDPADAAVLDRLDNTSGQNVGDVADFGWNVYNANYSIKEISDGVVWFGTDDASVFHETWFWTKEGENFLQDWTWTTYVKPMVNTEGGCFVQLMFGTAAVGGRYSLLIDPANGGYVQLYRNGMIANSWEEAMGATLQLGAGKAVELAANQAVKVTIHHRAQENDKGYIAVYMNDVCVMKTAIDNVAVGDYGLWLDAGMDAWFGNAVVEKADATADGGFVGAPIAQSAPVAVYNDGVISWSCEGEYMQGYEIYKDDCLIARLDADATSYEVGEAGNYTIKVLGNGESVADSEFVPVT